MDLAPDGPIDQLSGGVEVRLDALLEFPSGDLDEDGGVVPVASGEAAALVSGVPEDALVDQALEGFAGGGAAVVVDVEVGRGGVGLEFVVDHLEVEDLAVGAAGSGLVGGGQKGEVEGAELGDDRLKASRGGGEDVVHGLDQVVGGEGRCRRGLLAGAAARADRVGRVGGVDGAAAGVPDGQGLPGDPGQGVEAVRELHDSGEAVEDAAVFHGQADLPVVAGGVGRDARGASSDTSVGSIRRFWEGEDVRDDGSHAGTFDVAVFEGRGRRQGDAPVAEPRLDALLEEVEAVVAARGADDDRLGLALLQRVQKTVQERLLLGVREEVELLEDEHRGLAGLVERLEDLEQELDVVAERGGLHVLQVECLA